MTMTSAKELTPSMETATPAQSRTAVPQFTGTLCQLLEINRKFVLREETESLRLAQSVWQADGCPTDAQELRRTIEKILRVCVHEGIIYAPVLLLRKKTLDCGTWAPNQRRRATASNPAKTNSVSIGAVSALTPPGYSTTQSFPVAPPVDDACKQCGGSGLIAASGGLSASWCPCGQYMRNVAATNAAMNGMAGAKDK
jgi:hypothetical protein